MVVFPVFLIALMGPSLTVLPLSVVSGLSWRPGCLSFVEVITRGPGPTDQSASKHLWNGPSEMERGTY